MMPVHLDMPCMLLHDACCLTGSHLFLASVPVSGRPEESGISLQIVRELGPRIPVFGVCMGHQCIGQVFGGAIVRAPGGVMHGKTSLVYHNNTSLLKVTPFFRPAM
jgi:anthranilate/para-aminobenzoate synthase component II